MQLILRATSAPPGVSLVSSAFGTAGGSIGRNPGCTLILPDPNRYISRVHAEIRQQDGHFYLKVLSKVNPVLVNGSPIGFNQMTELSAGDVLTLGDYGFVAEVSDGEPAAQGGFGSTDPFAMFDGMVQPRGAPGEDTLKQDPFYREDEPDDGPSTVWGGIGAEPAGSDLADMVQAASVPEGDSLLGILQSGTAKPSAPSRPAPSRPASLDENAVDRFLGTGLDVDSALSSPSSSLSDSTLPGSGGMAGHVDHVHDINLPFNAPGRQGGARTAPPAPATPAAPPGRLDDAMFDDLLGSLSGAPQAAPAAPPAAAGAPADDLFSVLDNLLGVEAPARPAPPPPPPPAAAAPVDWPVDEVAVPSPSPSPTPAAPAPSAPAPSAPVGAGGDRLLAKLAEGLNMPGLKVAPDDAEAFMLELGRMFRIAVEGVHTLLLLRAEVKKELRAEDRTMIASRENNPLKHTETVEEALNYLLAYGAPNAAFLPPARAMADAFNDMRAHELAVMAGMRAGLQGVLKRFDPKALEPRIKKAGALDSVVPALYKAKLWDTYTEFYKDIESEAEDHFDKLFGREFVRAYMEQTKQLKKTKKT
ncbi:type VI secretion system-associated FHA domain protein TagH [Parasulfuritortus cantonensis]|uniref:Type VI secretion system-associated FHA domain protein TagH n=1 Tax=Parasulfuritortus cantonensis TaxID=2528202 RepID=A0A4R1BRY4_9PROT|nr:type VI secretion system-associated FHA domain protein TagH [Parasulfuritortus cantonensis]TCJ20411.1 type VI secretion system-associated FHA domain protein TagH [Parasulfuritortus cantonensis]